MMFFSSENVMDLLIGGETAYFKRFGVNFSGPIIPCGAVIYYQPITEKDKARLHAFGERVLPGIFIGYTMLHAACGGGWSGDLEIVDWEEIAQAEHFPDFFPHSYQR